MITDLVDDLIGKLRASVVHHTHERADVQPGVEVAPDEVDVAQQLAEPFERVVLALDRDQHLVRRAESVHGQQAERRGTVDEDVVVVVHDGLDRSTEASLTAERRDELDLRAREVEAGRCDEQALHVRGLDAVLERHVLHQDVVHRGLETAVLDPETRRGIALGVEVDDQDPLAELGETGTDVDRRRRLADAALLVGDGHHPRQLVRRPARSVRA